MEQTKRQNHQHYRADSYIKPIPLNGKADYSKNYSCNRRSDKQQYTQLDHRNSITTNNLIEEPPRIAQTNRLSRKHFVIGHASMVGLQINRAAQRHNNRSQQNANLQ